MLSDHEREALREIEHQLIVDDPDLEQSFRALRAPMPSTWPRTSYTVVIVVAALLGLVMLLAGSLVGVLTFTAIGGSAWLIRHRRNTAQPKRGG